MNITITGLIPSKKNSRINTRSGRSFPSAKFTAWHHDAALQLAAQGVPRNNIARPVSVELRFTFGTMRRCDLTNKAESIMDLLVDCCVLADDSWQVCPVVELSGCYEKDKDGCTIIITPME